MAEAVGTFRAKAVRRLMECGASDSEIVEATGMPGHVVALMRGEWQQRTGHGQHDQNQGNPAQGTAGKETEMAAKKVAIKVDTQGNEAEEQAAAEALISESAKPRPEAKNKRMVVNVKPSVHRDFMDICRGQGRSANSLINEWIEAYVEEHRDVAEQYRDLIDRNRRDD